MNKFTKAFKERAIRLKSEGAHPNQIFREEGIDIEGKERYYALKMINKWRSNKQVRRKLGAKAARLLKGIRKHERDKRIEYLEAQVTYLKAENNFLASLPKKKKK